MFSYITAITSRLSERIVICLSYVVVVGFVPSTSAANLIAHWTLNESISPYSDVSGNAAALVQDPATTTAIIGAGLAGAAAQLNWQPTPGTSTRLFATNSSQADSFGFSFWINPAYLNNYDNLIAKEMPYTVSVNGFNRIAWQVRLSGSNVSGTSPLEFIVRGNNPTVGNFFGNVFSATNLTLFSSMTSWIHVAGGYDSMTGALTLFVNGLQSTAVNGVPGAHSSDSSPFDIGTTKNGSDFVAFAAGAFIDDVQIYNGPLSASDVAFLMANPGQDIRPFMITQMTYDSTSGNITASVNSTNGASTTYVVETSTNLAGFTSTTNVVPTGQSTIVTLPKSFIDGLFGSGPRSSLLLRCCLLNGFTGCN
jgi:hypothetical protein